jgi:hypothetical protein
VKYKVGNIVLLNDGRTVYIVLLNPKLKTYHVFDIEDDNNYFDVSEQDIYSLVVSS